MAYNKTEVTMIDVKEAIQKAKDFARDVLGLSDLLLEEVSTDGDAFLITLSLPRRAGKNRNQLVSPFTPYAYDREFKEFRVAKSDGNVTKMLIRQIS